MSIRTALLLACIACCCNAGRARAEDPTAASRRDQLTAAYLTNFVKFVEWPELQGNEVFVCIAGADGVHEALVTALQNRSATIRVRRIQKPEEAAGCNVLYLDSATVATGSWIPAATKVLTVSPADDFARRGGMIALFTQGNRLRFNINLDTAQKAGLRIRAALLQLAASVEMSSRAP